MSDAPDSMRKSLQAATGPRPIRTPAIPGISAAPPPRTEARAVADEFPDGAETALRLAFLGTGQGGGRMVDAFYRLGYRRCAAFNLSASDFEGLHPGLLTYSPQIGGAAKDMQYAADQMTGREEELRDLLTEAWASDVDCGLICASLGGGTGSGTVAWLAELARKVLAEQQRPPRVGCVVSLPTTVEGGTVCRNAVTAFRRLVDLGVSPLIVVDNDRINRLYRPQLSRLHETANQQVAQLLHLFDQLAAVHSPYWSFDRSELLETLDSGLLVMGAAQLDASATPAAVSATLRDRLQNSVLAAVDLRDAVCAACVFVAGQSVLDRINLDFLEPAVAQVERMTSAGGKLHRGLYLGAEESLQAYVAVGGIAPPRARLQELAQRAGMDARRGGLAEFLGIGDGP